MVRKVILSRKGFDGTTGGKASPIIDENLFSLPIPRVNSNVFYKDLTMGNYGSYLDVMKDLNIKFYSEAHLDPDIYRSCKQRPDNWRGIFGQCGNSQKRLQEKEIGEEDIFLFFGWFKKLRTTNGIFRYESGKGFHAIYGFLEVDKVINVINNEEIDPWAAYHPHIKNKEEYGNKYNSVYIARSRLSFDGNKQGWGCFNYSNNLVLTKNNAKNKTVWRLPSCFQGERPNFVHSIKKWDVLQNGEVEMQTHGMADQEMYISSNPDVVKWAENLISTNLTYN